MELVTFYMELVTNYNILSVYFDFKLYAYPIYILYHMFAHINDDFKE